MSYKIEAQVKDGDRLVVTTDSRERALHYAATFMKNPVYTVVVVLLWDKVYIGSEIGKMP